MALMAEQALASGSPANNPRVPDKAEIVALVSRSVDRRAAQRVTGGFAFAETRLVGCLNNE